jgi:hypothetical protein
MNPRKRLTISGHVTPDSQFPWLLKVGTLEQIRQKSEQVNVLSEYHLYQLFRLFRLFRPPL